MKREFQLAIVLSLIIPQIMFGILATHSINRALYLFSFAIHITLFSDKAREVIKIKSYRVSLLSFPFAVEKFCKGILKLAKISFPIERFLTTAVFVVLIHLLAGTWNPIFSLSGVAVVEMLFYFKSRIKLFSN